jgi:hypothetical protein
MDNVFREKLEGFKTEPPAYLWDGIQGQLAAQRRKKRIALYSWVSVAALLVLAFLAGWYFNESAEKQVPQMAGTEKVSPEEKSNIGEQGEKVPEKDIGRCKRPEIRTANVRKNLVRFRNG